VTLDEGHSPRRQEQTSCETGDGISRFSACAFGERRRYDLRELVPYRPGPSLEDFAALDRLDETLAPGRKLEERALFRNQPMSEQS
jgi:hypothetical protein